MTAVLLLLLLLLFISAIYGQSVCNYTNMTLPISTFGHQTAYIEDLQTLYLFGGCRNAYVQYMDINHSTAIYKWTLSDLQWTKIETPTPDIPDGYFTSLTTSSVVIDHNVYFMGSQIEGPRNGNWYIFNAINETFLDTNTSNLSPFPYPSQQGCVTTNDSHIFMLGGLSTFDALLPMNQDIVPYLQIYDIANNQWSVEIANITGYLQYCVVYQDILYVIGARTNDILNPLINEILEYGLIQNEWNQWDIASNINSSLGFRNQIL